MEKFKCLGVLKEQQERSSQRTTSNIAKMSGETGLPAGWEVRQSRSRKIPYFFNAATRESIWEPPAGTDEDVLREYLHESNNKIKCSHLLVKHEQSRNPKSWKSPEGITRTKEEAYEILSGYAAQIQSGQFTLGELALSESDCSSAKRGGDLGYFGKGDMQKEFERAAFRLKVGDISGIVETASGLHIIERTA